MTKAIYPDIEIIDKAHSKLELRTILRKEHQGKYYKWLFISHYGVSKKAEVLIRFNSEVYIALILGKIDPNVVDIHGAPVFKLDPDQRSEEERLKSLLIGGVL